MTKQQMIDMLLDPYRTTAMQGKAGTVGLALVTAAMKASTPKVAG